MSKTRRGDKTCSLFITTRGKVKEASRCIIAGWVRTLFKDAAIKASPGSFRAAVNSDNWANRNLDLDDVIARGNWQNQNTFLKYYYKEINYKERDPRSNNTLSESFLPV